MTEGGREGEGGEGTREEGGEERERKGESKEETLSKKAQQRQL